MLRRPGKMILAKKMCRGKSQSLIGSGCRNRIVTLLCFVFSSQRRYCNLEVDQRRIKVCIGVAMLGRSEGFCTTISGPKDELGERETPCNYRLRERNRNSTLGLADSVS